MKEEKKVSALLWNLAIQFREELGTLSLAGRQLAPPDKREKSRVTDKIAARIDQSRFRMLRMVRNLEAFASLLRKEPPFCEDFDIVGLTSEVCEGCADFMEEQGLTLSFHSAEPWHVCAIRPEHIRQLLYHLLSNAMKYTPEGGSVRVRLRFPRTPRRLVELSVEDDGRGIEEAELLTLFARCQQDRRKEAFPHGVGLGLSICKRIAEEHSGSLTAESAPGRGSKFTLSFPDRSGGALILRQPNFFDYNGGTHPGLIALSDALPSDAFGIRNQA